MPAKRPRNPQYTIRKYQVFLVLAVGLLMLLLGILWSAYRDYQLGQQYKAVQDQHIDELDGRIAQLQGKVERLDTWIGQHDLLVERYGKALPGEQMIVLVTEDSRYYEVDTEKRSGWWSRVRQWFGGE